MPICIYKIAREYDLLINNEEEAKNFLRENKELSQDPKNLSRLIWYYKETYPKANLRYYQEKIPNFTEKFNQKISWIESVLDEQKII